MKIRYLSPGMRGYGAMSTGTHTRWTVPRTTNKKRGFTAPFSFIY